MGSERSQKLFHRSSFFSSVVSANNNSSNDSRPKFPIPSYNGQSQPIPTSIIPSMMSPHKQPAHLIKQHQLEVANALHPSYTSQTPFLLQNLHTNCDAMYFWRSLDYWRVAVGEDVAVEVEVGTSYNSGSRVPMRFGDYLDYLALCVEQEGKEYEQQENVQKQQQEQTEQEVAYLAQNELFPQVLNDVPIPHFCENGEYNVGEGKLYHTMLWMGPRNTVSPLHFDPLDNLLMQVVGWKRVLLFPPDNHSGDAEEDNNQGER
eukprot:CAMPEP_0202023138 /NCGR_PEP_ID=MMETSP0905-20130828/51158_1 /ASSEMBLY_ACC=CAM_ASM_000554 /TAXON_ID=420261 /ORGANISM="Thalassiosira antarctica, Strain CCMP982" /LENGTH=260 /DNA_ID=CAMNT_0048585449 /DNA_START=27 /DNA_END=805 /DNA_ORIENTATION=+